ncbi:hypothetical protein SRHO_G00110530 [Serrasalmus rhombeus]
MEVQKPKSTSRTGVKSTFYQAYPGPFPDPHILELAEKLRNMNMHPQPGICKSLLIRDKELIMVDSRFGPVPYGSVLSYQCPPENAPHLGASPDARVYDPRASPPFGLAEVKCCNMPSVMEVKHFKRRLEVRPS